MRRIPNVVVSQMLTLMVSSFGLVAALAWNEVVKSLVESYIKPYFGSSSGFISLLLYAVMVTILAAVIGMHLTKINEKIQLEEDNQSH